MLLVNVIHIQGHSSVTRSAVRSSDITVLNSLIFTRSVSTRASRDAMIFSQNQYWLVERIFVFVYYQFQSEMILNEKCAYLLVSRAVFLPVGALAAF